MGGLITLDFGAHHPEQVARLVAINPVVTGRPRLRPLAQPSTSGASRKMLGWAFRLPPLVMQPIMAQPRGSAGLHPIHRRTQQFSKSPAKPLYRSGRAIAAHALTHELPRITAPTLVIVGDRDGNVSSAEGRFAATHISGARLQVMRGGHLLTDEHPAEVLQL